MKKGYNLSRTERFGQIDIDRVQFVLNIDNMQHDLFSHYTCEIPGMHMAPWWTRDNYDPIRRITINLKGEARKERDCYGALLNIDEFYMVLDYASHLVAVDIYFQWKLKK